MDDPRTAAAEPAPALEAREASPAAASLPSPTREVRYQRIAEHLASAIRAGSFKPGDRAPSVRQLAEQQGVSLATAAQALRTVEDMRLIEAKPRSGYFVAKRARQLPTPGHSQPPSVPMAVSRSELASRLLRMACEPGRVSFSVASPSPALFDIERLRRATTRALQRHAATLLDYPLDADGDPGLRQAVARHLLRLGLAVDWQGISITSGVMDALTLALRAVTQPGDVVALESPTYYAFLNVLEVLQLKALEIPTCPRDGISVDALRLALATQPVRAIVLVPTLSNPLGGNLPVRDRKRIATLAAEAGVPVIEDVLCNDLAESDEHRRPIASYEAGPSGVGHVMLCGSFGKTIAPGLRIGWLASGRWRTQVERLRLFPSQTQTIALQRALTELLNQSGLEASYRRLRLANAAKLALARSLVGEHFPAGTRITQPTGGYALWIELPKRAGHSPCALDLLMDAHAQGISFMPGHLFTASDHFDHCLRLGVSCDWNERQRGAIATLGKLAKRHVGA